jgi:hypothetical protein
VISTDMFEEYSNSETPDASMISSCCEALQTLAFLQMNEFQLLKLLLTLLADAKNDVAVRKTACQLIGKQISHIDCMQEVTTLLMKIIESEDSEELKQAASVTFHSLVSHN